MQRIRWWCHPLRPFQEFIYFLKSRVASLFATKIRLSEWPHLVANRRTAGHNFRQILVQRILLNLYEWEIGEHSYSPGVDRSDFVRSWELLRLTALIRTGVSLRKRRYSASCWSFQDGVLNWVHLTIGDFDHGNKFLPKCSIISCEIVWDNGESFSGMD